MKSKEELSNYIVSNTDFENYVVVEGVAEPIRSTTLACPRYVDGIITYLVENGTYVEEGEVVAIIEDNEQQNTYDNLQISLENARAELNKVNADLHMQYALLEAQVSNNKVDTEIAQLDSLQLRFTTPTQRKIRELELEKAKIEKANFEQKLLALDIINQSEIKKMEINIQQLSNRLESAKKVLDDLTLKAPRKGLAIIANYRITGEMLKVGDNVWNNMPVIIMPETNEMKVKMMVSEADFKQINENDSVIYTFDAMPENNAFGKITKKLPVGQPYKRDSKVKFFELEASIDSLMQIPEPGFTVNCHVITAFVSDTIVVPQIAIYEVDSMKVVYVKNNKKYEMRQILPGISSMKESIVVKGLKRGEVVSLTKPSASMVKNKMLLPDSLHKVKSDTVLIDNGNNI